MLEQVSVFALVSCYLFLLLHNLDCHSCLEAKPEKVKLNVPGHIVGTLTGPVNSSSYATSQFLP